jgi:hypothetical protein
MEDIRMFKFNFFSCTSTNTAIIDTNSSHPKSVLSKTQGILVNGVKAPLLSAARPISLKIDDTLRCDTETMTEGNSVSGIIATSERSTTPSNISGGIRRVGPINEQNVSKIKTTKLPNHRLQYESDDLSNYEQAEIAGFTI